MIGLVVGSSGGNNRGFQNHFFEKFFFFSVKLFRQYLSRVGQFPHKSKVVMLYFQITFNQRAKFMGPTWGPPGSCQPQVGRMLAPWTFLSGYPRPPSAQMSGVVAPRVGLSVRPERRSYRWNPFKISDIGLKFGGAIHSTMNQVAIKMALLSLFALFHGIWDLPW